MLKEKDLFVWEDVGLTPEEIATAEADQGNLWTETPADAPVDAPAETPVPAEEVPTDTPAEVPVETPAETPETPNQSLEEMLNDLEKITKEEVKADEEVAKDIEEVKATEEKWEDLSKIMSKLETDVLTERAISKKQKMIIDILTEQNESLTKENLQYKYGNVDEDWVLWLINNDQWMKNILSLTIKAQTNPSEKDKLIDAYKTKLEELTWNSFDEYVAASKTKETSDLWSPSTDVSVNTDLQDQWESLFVS